ncbi:Transcription factor IIIA [Smittium mucronatum]|uniref:Transcription factor IIIA n=1 Tax=Smittium mucronatum TaxID=133383 RepID=A0A1R0GTC2_9FUNG|nr:Transcription factor IIIA [Smittium mucronatum]
MSLVSESASVLLGKRSRCDSYSIVEDVCDIFDATVPISETFKQDVSLYSSSEEVVEAKKICAYRCSVCKKEYKKPSKLAEHERSHTGERPYICHCGKAYMRRSHLAVHERSHDENLRRRYVCNFDGCGKGFLTNQHLKRHTATHSDSLFKCNEIGCNAVFDKRKDLTEHRQQHDGKRYLCGAEGCNSKFPTPSKLREHMRVHSSTPRYMCGYVGCTEKFTKRTLLLKHIKEIHKPTSYKCQICEKDFSRKDVLDEHMETHEINRAVIGCSHPNCTRFYFKQSSLNHHIKSFHEQIKPFSCAESGCGMTFSRKHLLARHKKVHLEKDQTCENINGDGKKEEGGECEELNKVGMVEAEINSLLGRDYQNPKFSNRHYVCPEPNCMKQFYRVYDMARHVKKMHPQHSFKL